MTKVMLVEDDNNLREIYGARLLAEGYEIVSAKDGEEALALAIKEKPDLIISDIMMPKISGFDLLDILRSTTETKYTKVIMMTALSQAEDKQRADRLGADRYLIKSQVTLEDVAKAAREVLGDSAPSAVPTAAPEPTTPAVSIPAPAPAPAATPVPDVASPAAPTANPAPAVVPVAEPVAPVPITPTPTPTPDPVPAPSTVPTAAPEPTTPAVSIPAPAPVATPVLNTPAAPATTTASDSTQADDAANRQLLQETANALGANNPGKPSNEVIQSPMAKTSIHTKVINPINDLSQTGPNLESLLAQEEAKEAQVTGKAPVVSDVPADTELEEEAETPPPTTIAPQSDQPAELPEAEVLELPSTPTRDLSAIAEAKSTEVKKEESKPTPAANSSAPTLTPTPTPSS